MKHLNVAHDRRLIRIAVVVCVVGLIIRLVVSGVSIGTNDTETWMRFGLLVQKYGLAEAYHHDQWLNHPPIPTLWAAAAYATTCYFELWWAPWPFGVLFRLPVIAADAGVCLLLWKILSATRSPRDACLGVCLFALSPANILISSYHSNTDSVCIALALWSLYLSHRQRWLAAGLVMGLAINIKIVPVLLIPVLIAASPWRAWWRVVGGLTVGTIPFLILVAFSGWQPIHNIVGYGSSYARWGIVGLLEILARFGFWPDMSLAAAQTYFNTWGKWFALSVMLAAGIRWGLKHCPLRAGAAVMASFLALSPGFGIQYLVYATTPVLAVSPRWGLWITGTCGAFAACVYFVFLDSSWPMRSVFACDLQAPLAFLGLLAWSTIGSFVVASLVWRSSPPTPTPPPANQ